MTPTSIDISHLDRGIREEVVKKDYRKVLKGPCGPSLQLRLQEILACFVTDPPLLGRLRDHQRRANWQGNRDRHLVPDLALID